MKIDITKPVQTTTGLSVRILCTDREGSKYSVVGLVAQEGKELLAVFDRNGKGLGLSLQNIPESNWAVVWQQHPYRDCPDMVWWSSKVIAKQKAQSSPYHKAIALLEERNGKVTAHPIGELCKC